MFAFFAFCILYGLFVGFVTFIVQTVLGNDSGILHMTEKAALLDIGNKESVWIPKSQMKCKGKHLSSNGGVVLIIERFASKKGLLQW